MGMTPLSPILSPNTEHDATLSVSSDSISQPTQVEVTPAPTAAEPAAGGVAQKLNEASLEDREHQGQVEDQKPGRNGLQPGFQTQAAPQRDATAEGLTSTALAPTTRPEAAREEGPQDLRVFELNSDSGKSTPSNNGKKGRTPFYTLVLMNK